MVERLTFRVSVNCQFLSHRKNTCLYILYYKFDEIHTIETQKPRPESAISQLSENCKVNPCYDQTLQNPVRVVFDNIVPDATNA